MLIILLCDVLHTVGDDRFSDRDAGGCFGVFELHCVVDLIDQVSLVRLKKIDRKQSTAERVACCSADRLESVIYRAIGGRTSSGGIGDPMLGCPVDRADTRPIYHKRTDISAVMLVHKLLDDRGSV